LYKTDKINAPDMVASRRTIDQFPELTLTGKLVSQSPRWVWTCFCLHICKSWKFSLAQEGSGERQKKL